MIKKIINFSLSVIFICSISIQAQGKNIELPDERSIYLVINGQGGNKFKPVTKIAKMDIDNENKVQFNEIDMFDYKIPFMSNYYYDYNFFVIRTTSREPDGGELDLFLFHQDKPWERKEDELSDLATIFPYKKGGQTFLVSYIFDFAFILNFDTMEMKKKHKETSSLDIIKQTTNQSFKIKKGQLKYIQLGLRDVTFPQSIPKNISKIVTGLYLFYESDSYRFFQNNNGEEEKCRLFKYTKSNNSWSKFEMDGGATIANKRGQFIVSRIGFINERGRAYPDRFTGKFIFIDIDTGEQQEITLGAPSKVLYVGNNFVIAKSENRLIYIPLIDGKISVTKSITLYQDRKEDIGTKNEIVKYIDGVFLGPGEIPEDAIRMIVKRFNSTGEEYYKKGGYSNIIDSIEYYKLALKHRPEYAQAYSNMGLSYFKIRKYNKSIETSLKAIELTDNDTIKASSYYNIALAYEAMEEWEKALQNYEKAFEYEEHDAYKEGIERMEEKLLE